MFLGTGIHLRLHEVVHGQGHPVGMRLETFLRKTAVALSRVDDRADGSVSEGQ